MSEIEATTAIMKPRSVAVIGASQDPTKRGNQVMQSLLAAGFPGPIYPVNPRVDEVLGVPTFPSVSAIDGPVDLALIATPAATLGMVLEECGRKGVRGAVVVAGGFAEAGPDGADLQAHMAQVAREHGVRFVGPNTNGLFRADPPLNLMGADIPAGDMAVISQSGNVFLSLMLEARARGAGGFSAYVGLGNQGDLEFADFLDFLATDESTRSVLLYAEGVRDGRRFLRSVREVARRKPIVILKSGRTEVGRDAVRSHSASLAGSPHVWDGVLAQAGAVSVHRLDEMLRVARLLQSTPPLARRAVAVISDGGGHAAIAADALARGGFAIPTLADETRERLEAILPVGSATRNPIDVAGGADAAPEVMAEVVEIVAADPAVAGIMIVGIFGGYALRFAESLADEEARAARRIAAVQTERGVPVCVQSAYCESDSPAIRAMRDGSLSVDSSIEVTALAMAALADRTEFLTSVPSEELAEPSATSAGDEWLLSEPEARELLQRHGVGDGDWVLAANAAAAEQASGRWGRPVALKIASRDIVHKSDVGGVRLNVEPGAEVHAAFTDLVTDVRGNVPDAHIDGVLVSPMAPTGLELFIGAHRTDDVGPVVGLGLGGRLVELTADVDFRAAPLTRYDAEQLVAGLDRRVSKDRARGSAMLAHRERLIDLMLRVSEAIVSSSVVSVDLNPVIAHPAGLEVVDARVVVVGHGEDERTAPSASVHRRTTTTRAGEPV